MLNKFLLNLKILIYKKNIIKQLDFLEQGFNEFEPLIRKVQNSTAIIESDFLQKLKKDNEPIIRYIESSNPYSFNKRLINLFSKASHKKLDTFELRYQSLCEKYLLQLSTLEKGINQTNQELQMQFNNILL